MKYTLLVLFTISILACNQDTNSSSANKSTSSVKNSHSGSIAMKDSLNSIYNRINFKGHLYENKKNLAIMEDEIARKVIKDSPQAFLDYATLLMKAGNNDKAIQIFDYLFKSTPKLAQIQDNTKKIYELLAVTHLRKGEIDNCVLNHNEESCLFPIKGKAIHNNQKGSRGAIDIYI